MLSQGKSSKMPCESCGLQFSMFRRKRACSECSRLYCAACLRRGGGLCVPCRTLTTRPLASHLITGLKVRDLQCFLQRQNVSTRGCVEKQDLVRLCVATVNAAGYRRRGAGSAAPPTGPFAKINDLISQAFERSPVPAPAPPSNTQHSYNNCHNAAHAHGPSPTSPEGYPAASRERFTLRPGGEAEVRVGAGVPAAGEVPRSPSGGSGARVDTADCFEIEDLDDAAWEFVPRPAEPLPNDSEILLTESQRGPAALGGAEEGAARGCLAPADRAQAQLRRSADAVAEAGADAGAAEGAGLRASSELELRGAGRASPDSASLQDSPGARRASLAALRAEAELDALSARQLKELLARNRVEYRGCVERGELLERARRLWREHARAPDADDLPLEDCCKICMAAPLECVLLECGHLAACTACSKQLAECPICRQYVVRPVRVFRS